MSGADEADGEYRGAGHDLPSHNLRGGLADKTAIITTTTIQRVLRPRKPVGSTGV